MIKAYYRLTKPGIIYGNAITALAGFFLASKGHVDFFLLLSMIIGLSLVIASACVFNNYIDRSIDEKMARTKNRALVKKLIPARNALIYAMILGIVGFSLLAVFTTLLATAVAFVGFFFYVVLYSIGKRRSVHGTIVGSVSGAVPPVVGYCAVSNQLDTGAIILFFILVFWQMPHFYAIAIARMKDYAQATIPVLPVKKGILATKIQMLLYIVGLLFVCILLTVFGYTGYIYLAVAIVLNLIWLIIAIQGFQASDNLKWARKMFLFSLIFITILSLMISVDFVW